MSALVTFAFVEGGSKGLGAELPRAPGSRECPVPPFRPIVRLDLLRTCASRRATLSHSKKVQSMSGLCSS